MMYGCAFCEIVVSNGNFPVGYSLIGYNEALGSLARTMPAENADRSVDAFLRTFDLLAAIRKIYGSQTHLIWEQHLPARRKWYAVSAFCPETRSMVVMLEDISRRKKLEQRLIEERKRYRALLKQSSDAVALVDAASQKIIDVNERLCQISGYSEDELCKMSIFHLLTDEDHAIDACQRELARKNCLSAATRQVCRRDGSTVEMERVGSLIKSESGTLELLTFYDVSEERRLQQILNADALLASQVQRQMLPVNCCSRTLEIAGIYKPLHMVSGDFFDYRFSENKQTLTGFLVDVAGHGLASALQTAAINVLLQDVIIHEQFPTSQELSLLNQKMRGYFDEGAFATLIIFHFDFGRQQLTCACCGINQFLTFCGKHRGWLKAKGSFIGAFDDPVFDRIELPIQTGDCFYFLTDGFSDQLQGRLKISLDDFSAMRGFLLNLTESPAVADDCSAICINIGELSPACRYDFAGLDEAESLQRKFRERLADWGGTRAIQLEIALNEAINNVLMHGSTIGRVGIRRIGGWVVMRVKDLRQGFDVQAMLRKFGTKTPEKLVTEELLCESGRGFMLMKLFSDRVYYNLDGSEVLLAYRLRD